MGESQENGLTYQNDQSLHFKYLQLGKKEGSGLGL